MAFFGVTTEEIESVTSHPNADKLSIGKLKGLSFEFVIGLNQFSVGQKVLYIPIDSVLPQSLIEALNLTGRLSGKDKNRLKSVKLRGVVSQGLVVPVEKLLPEEMRSKSSEEITSFLGVTKYDPPPILEKNANLLPLPSGQAPYDIEGADRNQNIVDMLMDEEVGVMEKMEGQNFSVTRQGEKVFVNQRNFTIQVKEGSEHSFWTVARKAGLLDKIKEIKGQEVMIYAEFCGPSVQGNIYGLKTHTLFVFDVKVDGHWMPLDQMMSTMGFKEKGNGIFETDSGLSMAPLLFKGKLKDYLKDKTIQAASNGSSVYGSTLREGIVVKPASKEQVIPSYGRLIVKQRSPEYLSGSDN